MPAPVSLRLNDAPKYEEFFGFTSRPFTSDPDPRFLYRGETHRAALDVLSDAVRHRDPLVLLTGSAGTGKTTICRALARELAPTAVVALVEEPVGSAAELGRAALQEFGVISRQGTRGAAATAQELADTLHGFLQSLSPIGATCVLIVDDAQRLPADLLEQLRTLSLPGAEDSHLLSVVLAGRQDLLDAIADVDRRLPNERTPVRAAIAPLDRDDVARYVEHRLSAAGGRAPAFEPAALHLVHQHARGVPADINALCDRTLTLAAQLGVDSIGTEIVDEAARGVGLAPAGDGAVARRVPTWAWIAIALLLALIAAWSSGAASALFP